MLHQHTSAYVSIRSSFSLFAAIYVLFISYTNVYLHTHIHVSVCACVCVCVCVCACIYRGLPLPQHAARLLSVLVVRGGWLAVLRNRSEPVLTLLALLVQKSKYISSRCSRRLTGCASKSIRAGTHFTGFTSTKVQILTLSNTALRARVCVTRRSNADGTGDTSPAATGPPATTAIPATLAGVRVCAYHTRKYWRHH